MKIVHVEDCFLPTAGYQLNFLAKWNKIHGHDVTIITSNSMKPWESNGFLPKNKTAISDIHYSKETGVKVIRINSFFRFSGREFLSREMFKTINYLAPDIIMIHGLETLTGIRLIINKVITEKYPLIVDSHMLKEASKNKFSRLFYYLFRKITTNKIIKKRIKIIAVSEATKNFLEEIVGVPEDLIFVASLGTDSSLFFKDNQLKLDYRKKLGISPTDFVIIYTGKFTLNKKPHLLLDAFKKVLDNKKDLKLIMVGSGNTDYAKDLIREFYANSNIIYLETQPVRELNKLYNAADIAVWPAASSLSFFDAQIVGLPVILEDTPINRERLKFNNGIVYGKTKEDLEKAILSLYKLEKEKISLMGNNGKVVVKKEFTYDSISKRIEQIMKKEIENFKKRRAEH